MLQLALLVSIATTVFSLPSPQAAGASTTTCRVPKTAFFGNLFGESKGYMFCPQVNSFGIVDIIGVSITPNTAYLCYSVAPTSDTVRASDTTIDAYPLCFEESADLVWGKPVDPEIKKTSLIAPHVEKQSLVHEVYNGECFNDDSKRLLTTRVAMVNTVAECRSNCKGYKYAGVEYTKECWCGNSFNIPLVPITGCTRKCLESNEKCGGDWAINVYSL